VDIEHGVRVRDTALALQSQVRKTWSLDHPNHANMLGWAAELHEIGLAVSHSQYQKHGAYLLRNADLSGFTRQEQDVLAALVLGHRRKFPLDVFVTLPRGVRDCARRLCVLLRLSVLMHRGRAQGDGPRPVLSAGAENLRLHFPSDWLDRHPLTRLELEQEAEHLDGAGIRLEFS
jgi:exopolyphosphatase/guanosine-5'-triphosphate,3'-diphosphate pyrophosphatase